MVQKRIIVTSANTLHGTEEYKCDYPGCNKSYGVRGNLYAHKKRVHKVHWAEKFD